MVGFPVRGRPSQRIFDVLPNDHPTTERDSFGELRLRLARAVVRPGGNAKIINPDNSTGGWISIENAVGSGAAFLVDVAADILAVDCDYPELGPAVGELGDRCKSVAVTPVILQSGQPGRLHLFARVLDRKLHADFVRVARDAGLDVRHSIRPPLTPHRLGLAAILVEPQTPSAALAALSAGRIQKLSRRMQSLLVSGDVDGRYRSRSEVIQALALAAVNAGWPFRRLFWELADSRNVGGKKIQEIIERTGRSDAERYLSKSYRKAEARARQAPPIRDREIALEAIKAIIEAADDHPWSGTAGGSNRAVLQAHFDVASMKGSLEHGLSVREAAERAGLSTPTASKAQRRLARAGWLSRLLVGHGRVASIWKLRVPAGARLTQSLPHHGGVR